jgi:acetyl-CoA carboxylase carboxyl transferase subunit alpha
VRDVDQKPKSSGPEGVGVKHKLLMPGTPRHYLEFERPIAELETKIEELSELLEQAGSEKLDQEIASLRAKATDLRVRTYQQLDAWQRTQVARHPQRPHFVDYLGALIDEFVELRGDRKFGDDQAIVGGLGRFRGTGVVVLGIEKGRDTPSRLHHNFGMAKPEGYRKAIRLMDLAEQYGLPVLTFVDTPGAYPGLGAEERGQSEAIARSTERCLTLGSPMVATIAGEGGSGGAIALAAANRVLILRHSIYSVISPEGGASILWRDGARAKDAAEAMKITSEHLLKLKIVDRVVEEPVGGAHSDPHATIRMVGDAIESELKTLLPLSPDEVRQQRADRFYAIGRADTAVSK